MNNFVVGVSIFIVFIIFYNFYKLKKHNKELNESLDELQILARKLNKKNARLEAKVNSRVVERKTVDLATREHTIIINSDENVMTYDFPYTLKNVRHVELISGIVPKSEYRINEYNNMFDTYDIRTGYYTDIISMLMQINQRLYDESTGIILAYDSVNRNVIAIAQATTQMNLDVDNSIYPIIGFEKEDYTFPTGTTHDANVITTSLLYFVNLKSTATTGGRGINNYPPSYYTFTSQFNPSGTTINIDPNWEYLYSPNRVNMKHQLYVDVSMDEVTYWDGTHRLARIYIPEEKEETEYESYGKPILRSLNQEYIDLDKLTFRLHSVVSETNTHPYDLNGLCYSLQVQITTVDPYILHTKVLGENRE